MRYLAEPLYHTPLSSGDSCCLSVVGEAQCCSVVNVQHFNSVQGLTLNNSSQHRLPPTGSPHLPRRTLAVLSPWARPPVRALPPHPPHLARTPAHSSLSPAPMLPTGSKLHSCWRRSVTCSKPSKTETRNTTRRVAGRVTDSGRRGRWASSPCGDRGSCSQLLS